MRRLTGLEQFAQLVSRSCGLLAKWPLNWYIPGPSLLIGLLLLSISRGVGAVALEVWPESHWPCFLLIKGDGLRSYTA